MQKITAGGGGAFLHPTHEDDLSRLREAAITDDVRSRTFEVCATYPDHRAVGATGVGQSALPVQEPALRRRAGRDLPDDRVAGRRRGRAERAPTNPWQALSVTVQAFSTDPGLALWCGAIVLGFFAFTDTHSRLYRVVGGLLHAVAHFTAMFYLGWGALDLAGRVFHASGVLRPALAGAGTFAGGWLAGSIIMGVYLLVSVNVFGRHSEEAFSGLRIEDFKHFLRLHVGADGRLTIWPVRIERVPRRWRPRAEGEATMSRVVPDAPLVAELIEPPIRIG